MAYLNEAENMQRKAQDKNEDMDQDEDEDEDREEEDDDAEEEEKGDKSATTSASLAVYMQLVSLILSSLRTALSHDTQHFFGKEHIDRLVPALTNLLPATYHLTPTTTSTTSTPYTHFTTTYFTPLCIQLCLTLSHFHHWKPLPLRPPFSFPLPCTSSTAGHSRMRMWAVRGAGWTVSGVVARDVAVC